jgi:eukaryotic-like serine/threonine-protein kinase
MPTPPDTQPSQDTFFGPGAPSAAGSASSVWTLPTDLQTEALRRLRMVALLYAAAYFLAGPFTSLLSEHSRAIYFSLPGLWAPAALSILGSLVMAALSGRTSVSTRVRTLAGLAFEVLSSIGIAAAEYHHISSPIVYGEYGAGGFGLSWVAVWVMLFSVAVPAPPRVGLIVAALSLATVPAAYALNVHLGDNVPLRGEQFFFTLVFPNLVVLLMAYGGARVVSRLGAAVRQARELGSYRLIERLGRGGMGEVWRAEHRLLARPAAIKLIRPEVLGANTPEARQLLLRRFEREAQATAMLRSINTIALYDFGVSDDGTFYHVMELLGGFDLHALVGRFGPLPAERVVHLLRQVCHSLGEAHEAGLIHRDIKPANIFTCRYGREVDVVKVLDFGLVKHTQAPEPGAELVTADQLAGGTPAFMAPEQALGEDKVDGRSDLYAVGCVGYWLLTGTLVFEGATPLETIVMHVHAQPDLPSRRTDLTIPPELESLILTCLAKDPAARPTTADELGTRLAAVPLERPWTAERAREWWATH